MSKQRRYNAEFKLDLPLREGSTEMIRVSVSLPFCRCTW
jgi:hypothetical protein